MVELIEPLQKQPLDDDSRQPDEQGSEDERPPIAQPAVLQQKVRGEGAQHVLGAVAEVDDVEHAEDHGQPQAEQRIERAVDQPDEQLSEQGLRTDAEQFEHGPSPQRSRNKVLCVAPQLLTSGQPPSDSGRNASSAG